MSEERSETSEPEGASDPSETSGPSGSRILIWAGASLALTVIAAPGLVWFDRGANEGADAPALEGIEFGTRAGEAAPREYAAIAPSRSSDPSPSRYEDYTEASNALAREQEDELSESFDCIIEPSERVLVGSAETGVLDEIYFDRSDLVEAGQVLARLESRVESMTVEVAKARAQMESGTESAEVSLDLGKRRRERAAELFEGKALSLDLRDEVETEARLAELKLREAREAKQMAKIQMRQAEADLQRRVIRSPISGVIVDRLKSPGEVVKEEGILAVAQIDPLRVEVVLPAALFGKLEAGMRAKIMPELPADGVYVASVEIVDRVIDPASGTFGVRLGLPNPDFGIPSGLHCQVSFLADETDDDTATP